MLIMNRDVRQKQLYAVPLAKSTKEGRRRALCGIQPFFTLAGRPQQPHEKRGNTTLTVEMSRRNRIFLGMAMGRYCLRTFTVSTTPTHHKVSCELTHMEPPSRRTWRLVDGKATPPLISLYAVYYAFIFFQLPDDP
jgi:hypothetical protein